MPMFPRITVLAVIVTSAVVLSGCLAADPDPTPSPSPSASPVFASEEEALAAATEAYAAYLKVADAVGAKGGEDVDRLADNVSATYLDEQRRGYNSFQESGLRTSGTTLFEPPTLQQLTDDGVSTVEATLYVCLDVTDVRILDAEGMDKTPADRPNKYPLVVGMVSITPAAQKLVVNSSEAWEGPNFCSA